MKQARNPSARNPPRTLMVFVDGVGLGADDPAVNPIVRGDSPCLARWLREAAPLDATMGVPGLPQSATGQTALLTGLNAAAAVGRHIEGFPGAALKDLIRARNVHLELTSRGYRPAFANAYFLDDRSRQMLARHPSVTTVAALSGLGAVRGPEDMLAGRAVYQDLTREALRARGYDGPLQTPAGAADDLLRIAADQDFTLFEYFQTDRAGHSGDPALQATILRRLDAFLERLAAWADSGPERLFVLTSDHGNLEDGTVRTHTRNPVPLVALGCGADHLRATVRSLPDFLPALLERYPRTIPR